MTRREARETAFALLFEWSFKDEGLDEIIEQAQASRNLEVDAFARGLAERAVENHEEIDGLIERYAQGWKLSRISRVTLAALRLSFCELTRFGDIPVGATINEAVELVKKYGTEDEAAYLNGILGGFERVRKGLKPAPPEPVKTAPAEEEPLVSSVDDIQKGHTEQSYADDDVQILDDIVIEVE